MSACAAGTLLLIQLPGDMPQRAEVAETDSKPLSISINIYFNISRVAFPLVGLACSFKYSNFHSPSLANKKERKKKKLKILEHLLYIEHCANLSNYIFLNTHNSTARCRWYSLCFKDGKVQSQKGLETY